MGTTFTPEVFLLKSYWIWYLHLTPHLLCCPSLTGPTMTRF